MNMSMRLYPLSDKNEDETKD